MEFSFSKNGIFRKLNYLLVLFLFVGLTCFYFYQSIFTFENTLFPIFGDHVYEMLINGDLLSNGSLHFYNWLDQGIGTTIFSSFLLLFFSKSTIVWLWLSLSVLVFILNTYISKRIAGLLSGESFFVTFLTPLLLVLFYPFFLYSLEGHSLAILTLLIQFCFYTYLSSKNRFTNTVLLKIIVTLLLCGLIHWSGVVYSFLFFYIYLRDLFKGKVRYFIIYLILISILYILIGYKSETLLYNFSLIDSIKNIINLIYTVFYPFIIFGLGNFFISGNKFTLKPNSQVVFEKEQYFNNLYFLIFSFLFFIPFGPFVGTPFLILFAVLGLNQYRRAFGSFFSNSLLRRFSFLLFFILLWPPVAGKGFVNFLNLNEIFQEDQKKQIKLGFMLNKYTSKDISIAIPKINAITYFSNKKWNLYKDQDLLKSRFNRIDIVIPHINLKEQHVKMFLSKGYLWSNVGLFVKDSKNTDKFDINFWKWKY